MIKYDHKALQASGIFIHGGHPNTMFKTLSPWVGQEVGDCSVQEEAAGAEGSPAQESHWGCRSLRKGKVDVGAEREEEQGDGRSLITR